MSQLTAKEVINHYLTLASQDRVPEGLAYLSEHAQHQRSQALLKKLNKRFDLQQLEKPDPKLPPLVRAVLSAYAHYLPYALLKLGNGLWQKQLLLIQLSQIKGLEPALSCSFDALDTHDSLDEAIENIEILIQLALSKIGYSFLGGLTLPYYGPYLYGREEPVKYEIELPCGIQSVQVVFMHDFLMRGWLDFATLGQVGTGGWAKIEALYCVSQNWDRDSDDFKIRYLKHEAQHLSDYQRFPQIAQGHQSILEYRAKLAELVYAKNLEHFYLILRDANRESLAPHAQAASDILKGFEAHSQPYALSDIAEVNAIARGLLEASDLELMKDI